MWFKPLLVTRVSWARIREARNHLYERKNAFGTIAWLFISHHLVCPETGEAIQY